MNERRQELWCHDCGKYVQFVIDMDLDGNHVLECPNCGHEHCRVVKDGVITSERWDSRNGSQGLVYHVNVQTITYTTSSVSSVTGLFVHDTSTTTSGTTTLMYV